MGATSLDEIYRRYFPAIREKCRRMLTDAEEAQDVAQETFIKLWRSGQVAEDPDRLLAWAYRTSTRLAIDRLRRRALHTRAVRESSPQSPASQHDTLSAQQQLARVAAKLSSDDLEVLVLERLDGLTQEEVARVVGTSHRTVRRMISRANERLEKLRQELGP